MKKPHVPQRETLPFDCRATVPRVPAERDAYLTATAAGAQRERERVEALQTAMERG